MYRLEIGGFLRFVAGMVAAGIFIYAGNDMRDLESVSGDSVAEFFYHAMGLFSYGMAALSVLLAIPPTLAYTERTAPSTKSTAGPNQE